MSLEAEQAVVAAALASDEQYDAVCTLVGSDDFTDDTMRCIWDAVSALRNAGRAVDLVIITAVLDKSDRWKEINLGPSLPYIDALMDSANSFLVVKSYAEIVKNASVSRRIIKFAMDIGEMAKGDKAADEKIGEVHAMLGPLGSGVPDGFITYREAAKCAYEQIMRVVEAEGGLSGLSTGFAVIDDITAGLQDGDLIVHAGRPSQGKAQPLDSKIRIPSGWTTMGALAVGDPIESIDGSPSKITGVYEKGKRETYKLTFSDGRAAEACAEHLWSVMYRDWDKPRIKNTYQLMDMLTKKRYKSRLWIDMVSVAGEKSDLPINPWVLGVLIGDGGLSQGQIRLTNSDEYITSRVADYLPKSECLQKSNYSDIEWHVKRKKRNNKISDTLKIIKDLGLHGSLSVNKRIPNIYLNACFQDRLELIRGLIDTDGCVEKCGSVIYYTSSKGLADDFVELARSLGAWCKVRLKRSPRYKHNGEIKHGKTAYCCAISHNNICEFVSLPRKRNRTFSRKNNRQKRLTISSIELSRVVETRCISVSSPSHLYITDDYVVTHNTALAMNVANNIAREHPVMVFSLEMSAAQLAMRSLSSVGRIHFDDIRKGRVAEKVGPLAQAQKQLKAMHMVIDDEGSLSVDQLRTRARIAARKNPPRLIVIDYLTLLQGKGETRTLEVGYIARSLKALAKEMKCPVWVLAQLNRSVDGRPNKRPVLSDLRDSGEVEQAADVVVFNYLDEKYDNESARKGILELVFAKQRNGETGSRFLKWEGQYQLFSNCSEPVPSLDEYRAKKQKPFASKKFKDEPF